MAYLRRSLSTRAADLVRCRCNHSLPTSLNGLDEHKEDPPSPQTQQWGRTFKSLVGARIDATARVRSLTSPGSVLLVRRMCIGASGSRYMSTVVGGTPDGNDGVSGVLIDASAQAAPTALSEVSVAAADSFFPVAALQHFIDAIHSFTGFNWWASIVIATVLIRGAMLPLVINQLKATAKLSIIRPQMEEINQRMQAKGMDPTAVSDGQKQIKKLFKDNGVHPLTPLKGLIFQGPVFISFFLAISNMVEKVPSFKTGGAYWFVDLTAPDSLYILPVLTGLTFLITVESNMQEGLEGNPAGGTMKKILRVIAVASVPLTMTFQKAMFCYWITSNMFSLGYGLALKVPGVKKGLGIPEVPVAAASSAAASQTSFNLFSALKRAAAARDQPGSSPPIVQPKFADHRVSSARSIVSQRVKNLEKQIKRRSNKTS
ncbi:unnamed protein product [Linum trigynum]|uniref:Membrane insertase YidC/Oxa/ALB C-terminal domain-containing protein n=1 Tax=Linum trigynum TaxID=586398 RepID=A0AAV2CPV9_9ROSI